MSKNTDLGNLVNGLFVSSTRNVGVGTTTPLLTATDRGNLTINGATSSILTLGVANVYSAYFFADASKVELSTNTQPMTFVTNGVERMRISSAGNLLLGTSTDRATVIGGTGTGQTIAGSGTPNLAIWNTGNTDWLYSMAVGNDGTVYHYNKGNTPIIYYTNATERMRMLANGNVLIGTASGGTSVGTGLVVSNNIYVQLRLQSTTSSAGMEWVSSTGYRYEVQGSNAGEWFVYNRTVEAYRLMITAAGNVGIGTTTPVTQLSILSSTASSSTLDAIFNITNDVDSNFRIFVTGSAASDKRTAIGSTTGTALAFITNNTERMRITSAGRVVVGASSVTAYGIFNAYSNGADPAARVIGGSGMPDGNIALMVDKFSGTTSTSQWFLGFTISNQGAASGVITANGASQAAFGSWSDRRLKENIVDLPSQLSNILALRPVEFDYIESEGGGHQISFIAQEFEEVFPDAVGERQDGMKTLTGWGKTEAILVKSIQELSAQVEELKAEIDILKNK